MMIDPRHCLVVLVALSPIALPLSNLLLHHFFTLVCQDESGSINIHPREPGLFYLDGA